MTSYKALLVIAAFLFGMASFTSQAAAAAEADPEAVPIRVKNVPGMTYYGDNAILEVSVRNEVEFRAAVANWMIGKVPAYYYLIFCARDEGGADTPLTWVHLEMCIIAPKDIGTKVKPRLLYFYMQNRGDN